MAAIRSQFVFINDTLGSNNPKSPSKRKAVRAQAARQQPTANESRPIQPVKSAAKWNRYQARKRYRTKAPVNTFNLSVTGAANQSEQRPVAEDGSVAKKPRSDGSSSQTGSSPAKRIDSNSSSEISTRLNPRIAGTGWVAPFVPLDGIAKTYFPLLVEHYLTNLATDIPELDAGTPFILRTKWFPMVITASATLNVVLLTAASHYAACKNLTGDRKIQEILLYLKYQTLASTNQLIHNSNSEIYSDAVIGAVAKMASYEAMFGLPELYHTHMRGLQNMIKQRGGLDKLGLDGLLHRMVLWIDINSAFILNSTPYIVPTVPLAGHIVLQQPNPGGFLGAT